MRIRRKKEKRDKSSKAVSVRFNVSGAKAKKRISPRVRMGVKLGVCPHAQGGAKKAADGGTDSSAECRVQRAKCGGAEDCRQGL